MSFLKSLNEALADIIDDGVENSISQHQSTVNSQREEYVKSLRNLHAAIGQYLNRVDNCDNEQTRNNIQPPDIAGIMSDFLKSFETGDKYGR